MRARSGLVAFLLLFAGAVSAGDVEILMVVFSKQGEKWVCETTLRHHDSGWDHYADAWRLVTADGKILGTRTLYHPHVDEQPFTRSLGDITIPADIKIIFVEAHDKVHGWSSKRVRIDLTQARGEHYRVNRSP